MSTSARRILTPVCLLALAFIGGPVLADIDESFEFSGGQLTVRSLIGEVTVTGHAGSSFEVSVSVRGDDATPANIDFDVKQGSHNELNVVFPIDDHQRYVYPRLGDSRTQFSMRDDGGRSWLARLLDFGGRERIKVSGRGSGLELWADIEIRVPSGAGIEVYSGVGKLVAESLDGNVTLDLHSGQTEARQIDGVVLLDNGSGRATAEGIRGDLTVDTGSGSVQVRDVRGDRVVLDTGSGRISFENVETSRIVMDTGSGGVTGSGLSADSGVIDTGSGSVSVAFDRLGDGSFEIDTGSGSVTLELPADASARIDAETGSGGVSVDFDGAEVRHHDRHEANLVLGSGDARITIDTGSGRERIKQR